MEQRPFDVVIGTVDHVDIWRHVIGNTVFTNTLIVAVVILILYILTTITQQVICPYIQKYTLSKCRVDDI